MGNRYFVYTTGGESEKHSMGGDFVSSEEIKDDIGDYLDCEYPERDEVKLLVEDGAEGDWQRYLDEYPKEGDILPCLLNASSYTNEAIFIFEDTFIEPCLNKLVDTYDGGYPGEWFELGIVDGEIEKI